MKVFLRPFLVVLCCFTFAADAFFSSRSSERTLHLAARSVAKRAEPAGAKKEQAASKDDDKEGDEDDDDDDDDDTEDTAKSAAKPAEAAKPAAPKVDPHEKERVALQKAVAEADQELAANLAEQKQLKLNMDHFSDSSRSNREIDASAKLVANETESVGMADMLAKMWKEMRMFELPSYTKQSQEEMRHLRHKEKRIEDDLTAAEAEFSAAKRRWAAEGSAPKGDKKEEAGEEKVSLGEKGEKDKAAPASEKPAEVENVGAHVKHAQDKTVESAVMHRWSVWHMSANQMKSVFLSSVVYLLFGVLLAYAYNQARFRRDQPFQPAARLELQNTSRKDFSFSIFGCFADPNVLVVGCCCPCLRWADTLDRKFLLSYWRAFAVMFGLMLCHVYTMGISTLIACIVGVYYRQRIRKKYGLDSGNFLTLVFDMMAWFCCQPCAIIQEAREEAAHEAP